MTVWTGIGPKVFETVVIGGLLDEHRWTYSTEIEALRGHDVAVMNVRRAIGVTPYQLGGRICPR